MFDNHDGTGVAKLRAARLIVRDDCIRIRDHNVDLVVASDLNVFCEVSRLVWNCGRSPIFSVCEYGVSPWQKLD